MRNSIFFKILGHTFNWPLRPHCSASDATLKEVAQFRCEVKCKFVFVTILNLRRFTLPIPSIFWREGNLTHVCPSSIQDLHTFSILYILKIILWNMGPHAWNAFPNTVNFSLFKWYLKISDRTHVPSGIYLNILKSVSSTLYYSKYYKHNFSGHSNNFLKASSEHIFRIESVPVCVILLKMCFSIY